MRKPIQAERVVEEEINIEEFCSLVASETSEIAIGD
jgi:hypothetical protein